jgi:hypothetical protein
MSSEQSLSWYEPGNIRATVENGVAENVPKSRIAEYLAARELTDTPPSRVQRIVERMPASEDKSAATSDLSQSEATDAEPRGSVPYQLAVNDLEYLSNREAARLIGAALEQFDGNTVRPTEATEVEADLVWHRQHATVALRIVPTLSEAVDTSHVDALRTGTVVPADIRNPSELAIVTNRTFTDEALALAEDHDIHCFDAGHVEEWFRRARIPMAAAGTLLEDGESHDGPLTDLVELAPIPTPRKSVDPLEINRAFDIGSLTTPTGEDTASVSDTRNESEEGQQNTGLDRTTARDDPLADTQPAPGETGTLYADPSEDGDFDVFDQFVDDIEDGDQQSRSTAAEESSPTDNASSGTDEKSTTYTDIDRKELMTDLLEAKRDADKLQSWDDVRTHGSYPVEYYKKTFGSLANALSAVGVDYTGETQ